MRAKKIQQRVVLNEVLDESTLLQEYEEEIEDLKLQLAEAKAAQRQQQNDEDTRELIQAIQKMEALILKTQKFQEHMNNDGKVALESYDSGELLYSPELGNKSQSKKLAFDTSESKVVSDRPLLDEMQRIQGLLDNVLDKKGMSRSRSTSTDNLISVLRREEEVEELRLQLVELEVTTSLKRADADFLQSQLLQKDALLAEVAQIREIVEKRQIQLESDNETLKRMLIEKGRKLAMKERHIADRDS
jgi:hypothetical protein